MSDAGRLKSLLPLIATLALGCAQTPAEFHADGFVLTAAREDVGESVQLTAYLDGRVTRDVDFTVAGGDQNGVVTATGLFVAPVPLPDPPLVRVTARTRTTPPAEDYVLLRLEACGDTEGRLPCALQGHTGYGQRVTLDRYSGRLVLLCLSATWCGPCNVAARTAEVVHQRLRGEFPGGFVFLEVLVDYEDVSPLSWAERYGLTHPVLAMTDEDFAASRLGARAVPTYLVITPDFRIRRRFVGTRPDDTIVQNVREAMAEYEAELR